MQKTSSPSSSTSAASKKTTNWEWLEKKAPQPGFFAPMDRFANRKCRLCNGKGHIKCDGQSMSCGCLEKNYRRFIAKEIQRACPICGARNTYCAHRPATFAEYHLRVANFHATRQLQEMRLKELLESENEVLTNYKYVCEYLQELENQLMKDPARALRVRQNMLEFAEDLGKDILAWVPVLAPETGDWSGFVIYQNAVHTAVWKREAKTVDIGTQVITVGQAKGVVQRLGAAY